MERHKFLTDIPLTLLNNYFLYWQESDSTNMLPGKDQTFLKRVIVFPVTVSQFGLWTAADSSPCSRQANCTRKCVKVLAVQCISHRRLENYTLHLSHWLDYNHWALLRRVESLCFNWCFTQGLFFLLPWPYNTDNFTDKRQCDNPPQALDFTVHTSYEHSFLLSGFRMWYIFEIIRR